MTILTQCEPAFISTPYTNYHRGWHRAYCEACLVSAEIVSRYKISVFCPIAHSHGMAVHGELPPIDPVFWEKFNKPFVHFCRSLIVVKLDGWNESRGVRGEIADFAAAGKPIYYCDPVTFDLEAA